MSDSMAVKRFEEVPGRLEDDPGMGHGASTPADEATDPAGRLSSVSKVLRMLGACLVIAATSTFMVQQWSEGSDVTRYLTLLALTAVLCAAGFLCGLGVREARGARTLLGLVLAAIPVHFAVLGAMLQSQFPWDAVSAASAPWKASTPATAVALNAVGVVVLLPLAWVAMRALVRPHAGRLTLAFLATNMLLCIPVRAPDTVGWMAAGALALWTWLDGRAASLGYAMRTLEGRFVRATMALPIVIAALRTVVWYEPTLLFVGLMLSSGGLALFGLLSRRGQDETWASALQGACAVVAMIGWFCLAAVLADAQPMPAELELLVVALPGAGLLLFLSSVCVGPAAPYRLTAVFLSTAAALLNLWIYWDAQRFSVSGVACLLVGTATLVHAVYAERKGALLGGALAIIAGFAQVMTAAIEIEHLRHWATLAAMGVGLIFVAALCERHARRLMAYAGMLRERIDDWEY